MPRWNRTCHTDRESGDTMKEKNKRPGTGAGRKASPKKVNRKGFPASRLLLAVVTLCNLLLTLALWVLNRRDVVHAIETDEGVKLLLTREKETKS